MLRNIRPKPFLRALHTRVRVSSSAAAAAATATRRTGTKAKSRAGRRAQPKRVILRTYRHLLRELRAAETANEEKLSCKFLL
jgi:hypothetical protein